MMESGEEPKEPEINVEQMLSDKTVNNEQKLKKAFKNLWNFPQLTANIF